MAAGGSGPGDGRGVPGGEAAASGDRVGDLESGAPWFGPAQYIENHHEYIYHLPVAKDKIRLHAVWLADYDP